MSCNQLSAVLSSKALRLDTGKKNFVELLKNRYESNIVNSRKYKLFVGARWPPFVSGSSGSGWSPVREHWDYCSFAGSCDLANKVNLFTVLWINFMSCKRYNLMCHHLGFVSRISSWSTTGLKFPLTDNTICPVILL